MAVASSRVYVVSMTRQAITTGITLLQIKPGATVPLEVIRATMGQDSSTTSTQLDIQINRKSALATVTSFTPLTQGPSTDPAASAVGGTAATGTKASAEGSDGNILRQDVWNYLNGWTHLPTPKDPIFADANGASGTTGIGLKLPTAPGSSVTLSADFLFEEKG